MSYRTMFCGAMAVLAIAPAAAAAQSSGTIAYGQEGGSEFPETVNALPSSGGTATTLAPGEYPSISPNGQTVAYVYVTSLVGAGQLRVVPAAGGTPTQIGSATPSWMPGWSPDGSQLVYPDTRGVYVVSASGGTPKQVAQQSSTSATGAAAFLSSSKLVVLQATPGGHTVLPSYGVRTMSTNGSGAKSIKLKVPSGWQITGSSLSVSASRTTIAFGMRNGNTFGVGIAPVGGGTVKLISGYSQAAFAPTGSQLCAQAGGIGTGALSLITTTGSVVSNLGVTGTACSWGS
jgi:Tol biopolymer transport system component